MLHKIIIIVFLFLVSTSFSGRWTKDDFVRKVKSHAVFFAVNNYGESGFESLNSPINDAENIAKLLELKYGFTTEIISNPTKYKIRNKLKELRKKKYTNEDQLLIYFSGHGEIEHASQKGEKGLGYFIPSDAKKNDEFGESYLSYNDLQPIIDNIPCQRILISIDACFSGSFFKLKNDERPDALIPEEKLIQNVKQFTSRIGFTSGNIEPVKSGVFQSPYAKRFMKGLNTKGGEDKILTSSELYSFLETLSPRPQKGFFGKHEIGGDFLFISNEFGAPTPSSGIFTDPRDGQNYRWKKMEDGKTWMTDNLNYKTKGSTCYEKEKENCLNYGRLYTWESALKVCPKGWKLPTDKDWWELSTYYGSAYNYPENKGVNAGNSAYSKLIEEEFLTNLSGVRTIFSGKKDFCCVDEKASYWTRNSTQNVNYAISYEFSKKRKKLIKSSLRKTWASSCRCIKE